MTDLGPEGTSPRGRDPHAHDSIDRHPRTPRTSTPTPSPRSSPRPRLASPASPSAPRGRLAPARLTPPTRRAGRAHAHGHRRLPDIRSGHWLEEQIHPQTTRLASTTADADRRALLPGDGPTCPTATIQRARGPRAIHRTGLDAPLCKGITNRQPQSPHSSHPPTQPSRSQGITPGASRMILARDRPS